MWRTLTQDVPALRAHVAQTMLPAPEPSESEGLPR